MKLCTAVQEGCGYKDTLRVQRYIAPLAKYFTVCITYQPAYVNPSKLFHTDAQTAVAKLIFTFHNIAIVPAV
jgi:hypothetical protein